MSTYFPDSFTDGPQGSCQSLKVDKKNIALGHLKKKKKKIFIVMHIKVSVLDVNNMQEQVCLCKTLKLNIIHIPFYVFYGV